MSEGFSMASPVMIRWLCVKDYRSWLKSHMPAVLAFRQIGIGKEPGTLPSPKFLLILS